MGIKIQNRARIVPKNTRVVDSARKTIDNLTGTWQQFNTNAISPDGRLSLLYTPKKTGFACSCTSDDILDSDGYMADETMLDLLDERNPRKSYDSNNVFTIHDSDLDEDDGEHRDIDNNLPIAPMDVACGVCFGTHYVGGYDLFNGYRIVLDTRSSIASMGVVHDSSPVASEFAVNATVSFKVLMPAAVTRSDVIRAWNNVEDITPNVLFTIDDQPVSADNLLSFCSGTERVLKLTFLKRTLFTHVEIQFGYSELLIDYSRYVNQTQNNFATQLGEFTLVLPPLMLVDLKGSIVTEATEGLMYRLTDMNRNSTRAGVAVSLECNSRVVQSYELTYALPRFGKEYPSTRAQHAPNVTRRNWL